MPDNTFSKEDMEEAEKLGEIFAESALANFSNDMKKAKDKDYNASFLNLLNELAVIHSENYDKYRKEIDKHFPDGLHLTKSGIRSTQIMALLDLLIKKGALK